MDGIFKKNNVYVYVNNKEERDGVQEEDMNALVYSPDSDYVRSHVYLYGGRLHLEHTYSTSELCMKVDGIPIKEIAYNEETIFSFIRGFSLEKVTAFLNQIENLGIDTFLENYKSQLQQFKAEMEDKAEKMEQEQAVQFDENKSTDIASLRNMINKLTCMIFCLLINMNAGLDNLTYTDAYNEIINLYF